MFDFSLQYPSENEYMEVSDVKILNDESKLPQFGVHMHVTFSTALLSHSSCLFNHLSNCRGIKTMFVVIQCVCT